MNLKYMYVVSNHDDTYGCLYHTGFNKRIAINIFEKIKNNPGIWVISWINRITGVESWHGNMPDQEIATGVLKVELDG
jgi:hypothetical protein